MSEQSEIIFQRLVRTMKTEESVRTMMDLLLTHEPDQHPTVTKMNEKIREIVLSDHVMHKFTEEMVNILGAHFTENEAQEILDWNSSPTGQKYSLLVSSIAKEFQARLLKYVRPLIDEAIKDIEEEDGLV